ncbi:MAG: helicase-related protein [Paenibacillaceae bacterium]
MKASLYAIRVNQEWSWRASLNETVDLTYGFHPTGGGGLDERLRLQPLLSWGQALWLAQWMNEWSRRIKDAKLTEVRGELIKALTVVKANPELLQKLELSLENLQQQEQPIRPPKSMAWVEAMQGRALLPNEWIDLRNGIERMTRPLSITEGADELQEAYLQDRVGLTQGIILQKRQSFWREEYVLRCSRCGSGPAQMRWTFCGYCEGPCPYCEACLTMGRARFCTPLVLGIPAPKNPILAIKTAARPLAQWNLNAAQTNAAEAGLQFLQQTEPSPAHTKSSNTTPCFLIWAVTGAGKTEMIYPLIEHELAQRRKVMIATPRKDVVLELMPRVQAAFPQQRIVALYGGSDQRWEQGNITLATTHQLLRFYQDFDLVIIDELDAFPYHNNPMLEFAARKACKPHGRFIFLSATPPTPLEKSAKRKRLPHVRVPVRFHQHPLPVPQLLSVPPLRNWVNKRQIPTKLLHKLKQSLERGAQLFLFVSQIRHIEPLVSLLRSNFADKVIQGTHSRDTERSEKVVEFRQTGIDILVTTTILERGITVAKTDVFVLDADAALFDEASLVQMAGRAGRSKDDPYGRVYYAGYHRTKAQIVAINQIKRMNAIAKKKGFLKLKNVMVEPK